MKKPLVLAMLAFCMACTVSAGGQSSAFTPDDGKKHFIRCAACHSVSAQARPTTGPHLEDIVGRRVASVEGFAYSDALRAKDFIWDEARLDEFLKSPRDTHPGMCLTFMGLSRPEDRAALIAYLKAPG